MRRSARFVTPVPKPRRRRKASAPQHMSLVLDEGLGLSTEEQQYGPTAIINAIRDRVGPRRGIRHAPWR